jgi:hypothetical protein
VCVSRLALLQQQRERERCNEQLERDAMMIRGVVPLIGATAWRLNTPGVQWSTL